MRQHLIDLLPADLRVQSQAGVRKGRAVAAFVGALVVLVGLITHSTVSRADARQHLDEAQVLADRVLELERDKRDIAQAITGQRDHIRRYRDIALPLEVSRVIATVVRLMPPSATLDRIDINCGARRASRGPRTVAATGDERPPRTMGAEISGFAVNDLDIAEYVDRLSQLDPLEDVRLDYSKARVVRDVAAREFRLSFRIDLDVQYVNDELGPSKPVKPEGRP